MVFAIIILQKIRKPERHSIRRMNIGKKKKYNRIGTHWVVSKTRGFAINRIPIDRANPLTVDGDRHIEIMRNKRDAIAGVGRYGVLSCVWSLNVSSRTCDRRNFRAFEKRRKIRAASRSVVCTIIHTYIVEYMGLWYDFHEDITSKTLARPFQSAFFVVFEMKTTRRGAWVW